MSQLLRDKETVSNVVTNMHDKVVLQLDTKEESISDLMKKEAARLVSSLADDEFRRNRNRIKEIATFAKHIKEDIDSAMDDMWDVKADDMKLVKENVTWPLQRLLLWPLGDLVHEPISRYINNSWSWIAYFSMDMS